MAPDRAAPGPLAAEVLRALLLRLGLLPVLPASLPLAQHLGLTLRLWRALHLGAPAEPRDRETAP